MGLRAMLSAAALAMMVGGCAGVGAAPEAARVATLSAVGTGEAGRHEPTMQEVGLRMAAEDRAVEKSFREMMEGELGRVSELAAERESAMVMSDDVTVRDWMVPVSRRLKTLPENVELLPEAQANVTGADLALRTRCVVVCCAVQKRMRYELMEPLRVVRTGDPDRPVEAVGQVEVKVWSRESEDLYPPVPAASPGFRMATKEEADEDGTGPWGHFVEFVTDQTGLPAPALSDGPDVEPRRKAIAVAICMTAEFREEVNRYELRYRWDVVQGKWVQAGQAKRVKAGG